MQRFCQILSTKILLSFVLSFPIPITTTGHTDATGQTADTAWEESSMVHQVNEMKLRPENPSPGPPRASRREGETEGHFLAAPVGPAVQQVVKTCGRCKKKYEVQVHQPNVSSEADCHVASQSVEPERLRRKHLAQPLAQQLQGDLEFWNDFGLL